MFLDCQLNVTGIYTMAQPCTRPPQPHTHTHTHSIISVSIQSKRIADMFLTLNRRQKKNNEPNSVCVRTTESCLCYLEFKQLVGLFWCNTRVSHKNINRKLHDVRSCIITVNIGHTMHANVFKVDMATMLRVYLLCVYCNGNRTLGSMVRSVCTRQFLSAFVHIVAG